MTNATAVANAYPIAFDWTDPETGYRWIHLDLTPPYDYDQVKAIPKVLLYEGVRFTRTGWDSDKGQAFYRDRMPLAEGR